MNTAYGVRRCLSSMQHSVIIFGNFSHSMSQDVFSGGSVICWPFAMLLFFNILQHRQISGNIMLCKRVCGILCFYVSNDCSASSLSESEDLLLIDMSLILKLIWQTHSRELPFRLFLLNIIHKKTLLRFSLCFLIRYIAG